MINKEEHCLICDSTRYEVISEKDRHNKELSVVMCRNCGFVFVNPVPTEEELNHFYRYTYREQYKKTHKLKAKHVLRSGREVLERMRFLKTLKLSENTSVLDIGTGIGIFLYFADKSGFKAEGIEPHQGYADYGSSALNVKIQNTALLDVSLPDSHFDVVTMHHVLEHLQNPVEAMRKAHGTLRTNGLLVAEVPNIMARYHAPRSQFHQAHLYYFSPWTLQAAAAKAGFMLQDVVLQPYTNHILAVFQKKSESVPFPSRKEDNFIRTAEKLRKHHPLSHYLSRHPYLRPVKKAMQSLCEVVTIWRTEDARTILDNLFERRASNTMKRDQKKGSDMPFSSLTRHNPLGRLSRHLLVHVTMPLFNFLSRRAYIQYRPDNFFLEDEEVIRIQREWEKGRPGNLRGDYARMYCFIQNVKMLKDNGISGAFAELGVYKGNTAKLLLHLAPERDLYLFDTFGGFPAGHVTGETPDSKEGHYACSLKAVSEYLGESPKVHYCQGIFPETAKKVPSDVRFALVHLDCDLYEPTIKGLEFFYPRLAPGGMLVLHDYKTGWKGVTRAVNKFFQNKPEQPVRIPDKSGTAIVVRNIAPSTRKTDVLDRESQFHGFNIFVLPGCITDVIIDCVPLFGRVLLAV